MTKTCIINGPTSNSPVLQDDYYFIILPNLNLELIWFHLEIESRQLEVYSKPTLSGDTCLKSQRQEDC